MVEHSREEDYPGLSQSPIPKPKADSISVTDISDKGVSALVESMSPDVLLDFVTEHSERLGRLEVAKVELELLRERNRLAEIRESARLREAAHRQRITVATLFASLLIVVSSFVYSGLENDRSLSEKVINVLLGVLGGSGATAAIISRSKFDGSD
ncbi:MAG: hypothetical protein AAF766_02795 [Cyanobacteria bacterium P01_D01_bin.14]